MNDESAWPERKSKQLRFGHTIRFIALAQQSERGIALERIWI